MYIFYFRNWSETQLNFLKRTTLKRIFIGANIRTWAKLDCSVLILKSFILRPIHDSYPRKSISLSGNKCYKRLFMALPNLDCKLIKQNQNELAHMKRKLKKQNKSLINYNWSAWNIPKQMTRQFLQSLAFKWKPFNIYLQFCFPVVFDSNSLQSPKGYNHKKWSTTIMIHDHDRLSVAVWAYNENAVRLAEVRLRLNNEVCTTVAGTTFAATHRRMAYSFSSFPV